MHDIVKVMDLDQSNWIDLPAMLHGHRHGDPGKFYKAQRK